MNSRLSFKEFVGGLFWLSLCVVTVVLLLWTDPVPRRARESQAQPVWVPSPTPYVEDEWVVAVVIEQNMKTGALRVVLPSSPAPLPTATPIPTIPPSPLPPTPTRTVTPVPSFTSPPTFTPPATTGPFPTPTPEPTYTTSPATPGPSPTPLPKPECRIGIGVPTLNLRPSPADFTRSLAQVHSSEQYQVQAVTFLGDDEWAQITASGIVGWIAVYYQGSTYAYYVDPDDCLEVRFPETAWGTWVGPGANRDELVTLQENLERQGIRPAATVLGEPETASLLAARGWTVAYRPFIGDCATFNTPARSNAAAWMDQMIRAAAGVEFDWLVICNEPVFPSLDYAREWIDEVIRQAGLRQIPRVVPVVWSPGRPELSEVESLASLYRSPPVALCWGVNLYPALPDTPLDRFDNFAAYTTYRPLLYLDDLAGVPVCITEFARSTGGDSPVFAEYPDFVRRYEGKVLWATAWYDAMPLGNWTEGSLRGKLEDLGYALIAGVVLAH